MFSKIACLNRWKVTNGCTCTFFSTVSSNCLPEQMQSRIDCICIPFSRVSFQMCPQNACPNSCIVALVAFTLFLLSEFLNVSLNYLPEQSQSRIGCICMFFLLSEFSDVSSNCLLDQMHSHIGCICKVFLQNEFSNVSLNCLFQQMHSHIGCICKIFLQEFSEFLKKMCSLCWRIGNCLIRFSCSYSKRISLSLNFPKNARWLYPFDPMDFSKWMCMELIHGFFSCYMDLFKQFHGFVKVVVFFLALFQTEPS